MPLTYKVCPHLGVVVFTFRGDVPVKENAEIFLRYFKDPLFDGQYKVLVDLAQCHFPDSTISEVRWITYNLEPFYAARHAESSTALYAPEDVAYGMSRMYISVAASKLHYPIDVFRTAPEALAFVGLDPALAEIQALMQTE
jgi:hypothetical protein